MRDPYLFLPCHSIAFSRIRFQESNGKSVLFSPHGLLQSMQVVCFSSLNLIFLDSLEVTTASGKLNYI